MGHHQPAAARHQPEVGVDLRGVVRKAAEHPVSVPRVLHYPTRGAGDQATFYVSLISRIFVALVLLNV